MKLFDIHCHLDHPSFKDVREVVERASKAGLANIITTGVNPSSNRKCLELASKFEIIKAAIGIYPPDALARETRQKNPVDVTKELEFIEKNKDKIVAIGEIGLDFASQEANKENQKVIFEKQLALARKLGLPVVVHSRNAEKEVIDILEKNKQKKVVLHFFSGKKSLIKKAEELGFYFSIPANLARSRHFQELVKEIPLDKLLTETDSPFASPVPGEMNEPANVRLTIGELAKLKDISGEEVARITSETTRKLFKL